MALLIKGMAERSSQNDGGAGERDLQNFTVALGRLLMLARGSG